MKNDEYHNRTIQSQYGRIDTEEKPSIDEIADELQKLREKVAFLMEKRIMQTDIVPDSIKTRAMGEGNRYVIAGLDADRPTGYTVPGSTLLYFATDTNKLWIYNGVAWKSQTLT